MRSLHIYTSHLPALLYNSRESPSHFQQRPFSSIIQIRKYQLCCVASVLLPQWYTQSPTPKIVASLTDRVTKAQIAFSNSETFQIWTTKGTPNNCRASFVTRVIFDFASPLLIGLSWTDCCIIKMQVRRHASFRKKIEITYKGNCVTSLRKAMCWGNGSILLVPPHELRSYIQVLSPEKYVSSPIYPHCASLICVIVAPAPRM